MAIIARPGDDLDVGALSPRREGDVLDLLRLIHGDGDDLDLRDIAGAQEFRPRGIAIINGLSRLALMCDHLRIAVDGDVGNAVLFEHLADEAADAAEAGDDDARLAVAWRR